MAKVNIVDKKVKLELDEIVKFQLITHCYIERLMINESDLDCLTLLGVTGESDLSEFCALASTNKIFKTTQTVRNCITKLERMSLIVKVGKSKKKIILNPNTKVQTSGNILLNYKVFYIDPEKS